MIIDLRFKKTENASWFCVSRIPVEGMSNLISGISELKIQDVINHSEIPNLDFITAGPIPPNPSELIQSNEMSEIIELVN